MDMGKNRNRICGFARVVGILTGAFSLFLIVVMLRLIGGFHSLHPLLGVAVLGVALFSVMLLFSLRYIAANKVIAYVYVGLGAVYLLSTIGVLIVCIKEFSRFPVVEMAVVFLIAANTIFHIKECLFLSGRMARGTEGKGSH
jgi:hypothetical protein